MIVRLKPYLEPKVWGSKKLNKRYHHQTDEDIGEAWGISMIKGKESMIQDGDYTGMPFSILFENNHELFGGLSKEFPLLVKVIDAHDDLSVQVHPKTGKDEKNEAWVVLDAKKDAKLILGHKADSLHTFQDALRNDKLADVLLSKTVNKGDQFFVEAGKLHGIGRGIELFEIQQASDKTYRVYDYDRLVNNEKRSLHLSDAFSVMCFPDEEVNNSLKNRYFDVEKVTINKESSFLSHQYGDYLYVVAGEGKLNERSIKAHDFIFVSSREKYTINGQLELLKSTILKAQED